MREFLYRRKTRQREAVINNIQANRRNATQSEDQHPDLASTTSEELEAALTRMTDAELDTWIEMRSEGDTLPELDLEVEESAAPYAKPGVA